MYQHDLNEKELISKLSLATIDAVAFVGVDINTCSSDVLKYIPGLNRSIVENIISSRPFRSRGDLLKVKGIGPKTYENCAGFVRVHNSISDFLDETKIHPESYELAKYLLEKLGCESLDCFSQKYCLLMKRKQKELLQNACSRYKINYARVNIIVDLLKEESLRKDPRQVLAECKASSSISGTFPSSLITLPRQFFSNFSLLKEECPLRNISGIIRTVTDFGAFVDFGFGNDGLLHRSKIDDGKNDIVYVGSHIGIDIVKVEVESKRISLALTGGDITYSTKNQLNSTKVISRKRKRNCQWK